MIPAANLQKCITSLDVGLLAHESWTSESRWPEYSGDPVSLNFKFVTAYNEVLRDKFREAVDIHGARGVRGQDRAPFTSGINVKDKSGAVKAVHYARLVADGSGMPYPAFIRFCFDFAERRGPKWLPRPNQLIPRGKFLDAFMRELEKLIDERLPVLLGRYRSMNPSIGSNGVSKPSIIDAYAANCPKAVAEIKAMMANAGRVSLADKRLAQGAARASSYRVRQAEKSDDMKEAARAKTLERVRKHRATKKAEGLIIFLAETRH